MAEQRVQADPQTAELDALLARALAGDARARERLVLMFRPLALSMARLVSRSGEVEAEEAEEAEAAAVAALVEALSAFDLRAGAAFAPYAKAVVRGHLMALLRQSAPVTMSGRNGRAMYYGLRRTIAAIEGEARKAGRLIDEDAVNVEAAARLNVMTRSVVDGPLRVVPDAAAVAAARAVVGVRPESLHRPTHDGEAT